MIINYISITITLFSTVYYINLKIFRMYNDFLIFKLKWIFEKKNKKKNCNLSIFKNRNQFLEALNVQFMITAHSAK